ncbi:cytochrome c3 family protein [bacterium]|nr:cytochrome c3 family protein [bacterium]
MNKNWLYLPVTGYFLLAGVLVAGLGFHRRATTAGRLEQPIQFPHDTHVITVGLACIHCHTTADRSPEAGVPAVSVCMECHQKVKTDSPEIKKLTEHWNNEEPIEWTKIHQLPWHVRFTHKRHIKAGVDCAVCHGQVNTMTQVRQVRSLEMGWCVRCHQENRAPSDCWACHK